MWKGQWGTCCAHTIAHPLIPAKLPASEQCCWCNHPLDLWMVFANRWLTLQRLHPSLYTVTHKSKLIISEQHNNGPDPMYSLATSAPLASRLWKQFSRSSVEPVQFYSSLYASIKKLKFKDISNRFKRRRKLIGSHETTITCCLLSCGDVMHARASGWEAETTVSLLLQPCGISTDAAVASVADVYQKQMSFLHHRIKKGQWAASLGEILNRFSLKKKMNK